MTDIKQSPIAVLGAGSWGTALAILLASNGQQTRLWGRNAASQQALQNARENSRFLPGIPFPDLLTVYDDLAQCIAGVEDILIVVPSHGYKDLCEQLKPLITDNVRIVSATKGLHQDGTFLSDITKAVLGESRPWAILSGPSFAKEVAQGLPTAVTLASESEAFVQAILPRFHCDYFRVYLSHDIIGVQLCGALKNILAIAAGMCDGLGYGANTRAALITRGLAELTRLGIALGAQEHTFMGLAGMGDLVLTATDNQSRNRRFGIALGQGQTPQQAQQSIGQVVEGATNVEQAHQLAKRLSIDLPITEHVHAILVHQEDPATAVKRLFARTPKWE